MAILRFGSALLGSAMMLAAIHPAGAQTQAPAQPSFDQLNAEAKKAQAAKDAEAAKQEKPADAAVPAATDAAPAVVTPAVDGTVPAAVPAADGAQAGGEAKVGDVPVAAKPKLDKHGNPIKVKAKKEKPPKLIPVTIVKGALTVDGLIAKADLNFQILDLKCFYIWVPGIGTTVISNYAFPGAKLQLDVIAGPMLTVKVDGHQLQLAADRDLLGGKKPKPLSMYVALDKDYARGTIYPEFGYGDGHVSPYNWPGTLADVNPNPKAPPLPDNLKQKTQSVKMCAKNADGTEGACRVVEVPMVTSKKGS